MTSIPSIIPDWDYAGVLPANDAEDPTSEVRSPFAVSLYDLVARFGNTEHRRRLLRGLLAYRAELHSAGLVRGFQWINGSFTENVEERDARPPNDIDVVTFLYIPDEYAGETFVRNFPFLFDKIGLKNDYSVDAYYSQLNQTTPEEIIKESTYWYSLWSHTRGGKWKGYLQIDLARDDDEQAKPELDRLHEDEGGHT